jgi:hypothetical protein
VSIGSGWNVTTLINFAYGKLLVDIPADPQPSRGGPKTVIEPARRSRARRKFRAAYVPTECFMTRRSPSRGELC